MNWILGLLTFVLESGYGYRTICTYRSTILALHNKIEGRPVGEHPQVSFFITSVFNKRPRQPKYNLIWYVQLVLDYLKQRKLSYKLFTFKVTKFLVFMFSYFRCQIYGENFTKMFSNSTNYINLGDKAKKPLS